MDWKKQRYKPYLQLPYLQRKDPMQGSSRTPGLLCYMLETSLNLTTNTSPAHVRSCYEKKNLRKHLSVLFQGQFCHGKQVVHGWDELDTSKPKIITVNLTGTLTQP